MTPEILRRLALSLPEAIEGGHMGHPDFRVGGKIFATQFRRDGVEYGMAKLKPDQQRKFLVEHPGTFTPAPGAWGKRGATVIDIARVKTKVVRSVLLMAWINTAPKRLIT